MKWPEYPLASICERFLSGGTPSTKIPEYWTGDIPWITGADIVDGEVILGRRYINEVALKSSATNVVPKGSLLMVTRTGVGKIALAPTDIAISQDFTGIVLKQGIHSKYVLAAIRSRMPILLAVQRGATIKGVTRDDVEQLEIPVPPPSERKKIVEILDQADALRKKRAEADAKAARILPALFYKMFGDPLKDARDSFQCLVECAEIIMGQSPPGESYNQEGDGLPFFQGKMEFGSVNPTVRQWCSSPTRIAEPGDVLLCVRAPVGPTNIADTKCAIGRGLAIARPILGKSTTEFLFYSLRAIEKEIAKIAQGSTFTAIRRQDVENIRVPKAGVKDQSAFSAKAKTIQELLDKGVSLTTNIEKLFNVLLHRTFAGDLTAKWREAHIKELLAEMETQSNFLNQDYIA